MFTLNYVRSYRKNGSLVHVFVVTGAQEEVAKYETAKGSFLRKDDTGAPLYFTTLPFEGNQVAASWNQKGTDLFIETDLREEASTIQAQSLKTQGTLDGIRRYAGVTKATIVDKALNAIMA